MNIMVNIVHSLFCNKGNHLVVSSHNKVSNSGLSKQEIRTWPMHVVVEYKYNSNMLKNLFLNKSLKEINGIK